MSAAPFGSLRRLPIAVLLVLGTLIPAGRARSQDSGPAVIPLIPAADWRLTQTEKLGVDAVAKWGGDPAIDAEYGVRSVVHRTYQFENHIAEVILEQSPDPSSAYGLFTYYRTPSLVETKNLLLAASGPSGTLMARGPVFIRVSEPTQQPLQEMDLRALLLMVGGQSSETLLDGLPEPLPAEGLVASTTKYVLGPQASAHVLPAVPPDLIGFDKGGELQLASYVGPTSRGGAAASPVTLAVVSYPNPQIAGAQFALLTKGLGLNQDHGSQTVFGVRQGQFALMVIGAASSREAQTFLNDFKVQKQFSWTPPYPGDKSIVIQMVELVLANAQLVIILSSFSVIGGLLVFASKRIARKWIARSAIGQDEESGITILHLS